MDEKDYIQHSGTQQYKTISAGVGDILSASKNSLPCHIKIDKLNVWMPGTLSDRILGTCSAKIKKKSRAHILKNINASLPHGCLIAIMGTSGSGKTTLLNTIAGRMENKEGGAEIRGNAIFSADQSVTERLKTLTTYPSVYGYVLQHDHLLPNLTTKETLMYAGLMKLPSTMTFKQKRNVVHNILMQLGLRDCANIRVGGDGKQPSISGGERRRVSIGVQMLTDPSVLFLDEPTTGLDSFTANYLIQMLHQIAVQSNRTIICTVHQPRSDIFHLFDYTMLLTQGSLVYFGPAGEHVINYFNRLDYPCPPDTNPADFLLDLITVDNTDPIEEKNCRERLVNLIQHQQMAQEEERKILQNAVEGPKQDKLMSEGQHKTRNPRLKWLFSKSRISPITQTFILFHRLARNTFRNRSLIVAKLLEPILMGIAVGLIFFQLTDSLTDVQSSVAALYSCASLQPYLILLAAMLQASEELPVFDRDLSDKMLDVVPYFIAQIMNSMIFAVLTPMLFTLPYYFLVGLRPGFEYVMWFYLLLGALQYCLEAFGFLCSCIFRDYGVASVVANSIMTFWNLSCGFLINIQTFPIYLTWISYTSPFLYGFAGLAENQFQDLTYTCPDNEDSQCFYNGNFVLANLHLKVEEKGQNLAILISAGIILRLISLIILKFYKQPPK